MNNFWRRLRFELWYYQRPPWDTQITPPELAAYVQQQPPGLALDLGCGTGTNAIYLAKHSWQVTGIDFSWKAIRMAKRKTKHERSKVDFRVGDVTDLKDIEEQFNLILDIGCFHILNRDQRAKYLENLDQFLIEGGSFLMYGFLNLDGTSFGISNDDLNSFAQHLQLVWRQDGQDTDHPSTWIEYKR